MWKVTKRVSCFFGGVVYIFLREMMRFVRVIVSLFPRSWFAVKSFRCLIY